MALDVTAEAGLYSGAGDPLNGAQVRPVEMSESDRSLVIRRISDDIRLAETGPLFRPSPSLFVVDREIYRVL